MKSLILSSSIALSIIFVLASCTPSSPPSKDTSPSKSWSTLSGATSAHFMNTLSYINPKQGKDQIDIMMDVENGIIVRLITTPKTENPISTKWQKSFGEAAQKQIVGKSLKNLDVQAVGGASLTTAAFVTYVKTIQ